jgi:hypothetical protein
MVSGPWDFAGVLFAASGILLLGGPAILSGLYEQWHIARLLGQGRYLQGVGEHRIFWISLWLLYFAVVAGGSALVMWRRRGLTSIYNIEPQVFTKVLTQVLDGLGVQFFRTGPRRFVVRFPTQKETVALISTGTSDHSSGESPVEGDNEFMSPVLEPAGTVPVIAKEAPPCADQIGGTTPPAASLAYPWAELDVDFFAAMRHVLVHWRGEGEQIRPEIEAGLAEALALVHTGRTPVAVWFLTLALAMFFSAFVILAALAAMQILQLRR